MKIIVSQAILNRKGKQGIKQVVTSKKKIRKGKPVIGWFVSYFGNELVQTNLGNVQTSFIPTKSESEQKKILLQHNDNALPTLTVSPQSSSF